MELIKFFTYFWTFCAVLLPITVKKVVSIRKFCFVRSSILSNSCFDAIGKYTQFKLSGVGIFGFGSSLFRIVLPIFQLIIDKNSIDHLASQASQSNRESSKMDNAIIACDLAEVFFGLIFKTITKKTKRRNQFTIEKCKPIPKRISIRINMHESSPVKWCFKLNGQHTHKHSIQCAPFTALQ